MQWFSTQYPPKKFQWGADWRLSSSSIISATDPSEHNQNTTAKGDRINQLSLWGWSSFIVHHRRCRRWPLNRRRTRHASDQRLLDSTADAAGGDSSYSAKQSCFFCQNTTEKKSLIDHWWCCASDGRSPAPDVRKFAQFSVPSAAAFVFFLYAPFLVFFMSRGVSSGADRRPHVSIARWNNSWRRVEKTTTSVQPTIRERSGTRRLGLRFAELNFSLGSGTRVDDFVSSRSLNVPPLRRRVVSTWFCLATDHLSFFVPSHWNAIGRKTRLLDSTTTEVLPHRPAARQRVAAGLSVAGSPLHLLWPTGGRGRWNKSRCRQVHESGRGVRASVGEEEELLIVVTYSTDPS